jgi:OOP family OmpA-OmpF porin
MLLFARKMKTPSTQVAILLLAPQIIRETLMKIKYRVIAAVASGLFFAPPIYAVGNPGAYWTDPEGEPYRNAEGECWKSPDWTEADATRECNPELVPKPKPKPVVAEPQPVPPPPPQPVVEKVSLGADTYFSFDSAQLTAGGIQEIENLAQRLKMGNFKDLRIDIAGHTDSLGSEAYNQSLSERRAASVKKEFVESGIPATVITTRGYGETVPVASNATPEGRAKNRRVDVTILGRKTVME